MSYIVGNESTEQNYVREVSFYKKYTWFIFLWCNADHDFENTLSIIIRFIIFQWLQRPNIIHSKFGLQTLPYRLET